MDIAIRQRVLQEILRASTEITGAEFSLAEREHIRLSIDKHSAAPEFQEIVAAFNGDEYEALRHEATRSLSVSLANACTDAQQIMDLAARSLFYIIDDVIEAGTREHG